MAEGGAAFDVNYLWFDGGLDRAWRSMGTARVRPTRIDVAGADAARLVVQAGRQAGARVPASSRPAGSCRA